MLETFQSLIAVNLREGVSVGMLIPAGACLALLLAYASYTDIYRGHVIFNLNSLGVICVSWAIIPLIFENPLQHAAWGLVPVMISAVLVTMNAQGAGDFKLYAGLCLLLGPAGFALFIISMFVTVFYAVPVAVRSYHANKGKQVARGQRLGVVPAGPGIAIAFPLTLIFLGAPAVWCCAMLGFGAAMVLLFRMSPKVEAEREPYCFPAGSLED